MSAPASPPALRHRLPSWLDLRLVLGVLLVLISVLVGAKVVASADKTVRVWAVNRDLAAGTVLGADDLRQVRVRLLDSSSKYLVAGRTPEGQTLTRDVGSQELLPKEALTPTPCGNLVSIPVSAQHLPATIAKGQRIDLFATPKGNQADRTEQVLHAVTVQLVQRPRGGLISSGAEWSLVVRVPVAQLVAVVRAIRTADLDVTVVEQSKEVVNGGCGGPPQSGDGSTQPTGAGPTPAANRGGQPAGQPSGPQPPGAQPQADAQRPQRNAAPR